MLGHVSIGGGGDFCFPAGLRRGGEAYILARVVPTSPVKARGVVQQQQLLWKAAGQGSAGPWAQLPSSW